LHPISAKASTVALVSFAAAAAELRIVSARFVFLLNMRIER
jgi:hypothetical protein